MASYGLSYGKWRPAPFFCLKTKTQETIYDAIFLQQKKEYKELYQILSFQKGEESGFNFLFREFYAPLTYYSFKFIKHKAVAEEIAAEALMKLWERREKFDNYAVIKSFLYTVTRNASLDYLKVQGRAAKKLKDAAYLAEVSQGDIFAVSVEAEAYTEVLKTINTLPPQCKRIFTMLFFERKEYAQIAKELNLSIRTVRNQKARAISLIKQRVAFSLIIILLSIFL